MKVLKQVKEMKKIKLFEIALVAIMFLGLCSEPSKRNVINTDNIILE